MRGFDILVYERTFAEFMAAANGLLLASLNIAIDCETVKW